MVVVNVTTYHVKTEQPHLSVVIRKLEIWFYDVSISV